MVEPHSSNFRVITTNFLGVRIFRKITVFKDQDIGFLHFPLERNKYKFSLANFTLKTEIFQRYLLSTRKVYVLLLCKCGAEVNLSRTEL